MKSTKIDDSLSEEISVAALSVAVNFIVADDEPSALLFRLSIEKK